MKKTLIATAIAATTLGSFTANADIAVTNMVFGPTYGIDGTLAEAGGGFLQSTGLFFGHTFNASQQTTIMDNTGSWAGTSLQGGFDYTATIQAIPAGSSAAGLYFNWNTQNEIAVLAIFDCNGDASGDVCNGTGTPMQNGPFIGSAPIFNGNEVPVPAAIWLMGSGLLGLVGVARRRKA